MKRMVLILVLLFIATLASAKVVSKTLDDCENEGLQHSWIYSVPEEFTGWVTSSNVIYLSDHNPTKFKEVPDNNSNVVNSTKVIRLRKCRNCRVVEELHQTHKEEWVRK